MKNKYSAPRVNLETHLETIRSYLSEYKTLPEDQQTGLSRIFIKFILTSCWPKMHRRLHSWPSLSLIMQLCAIDHMAFRSLNSEFEPTLVQPDTALCNFLQTGWDTYLLHLLDHYPNATSRSTTTAPLPQKLLDAITSKTMYTFSADVATDFHNLLTSCLIAYIIRLDYVDRALRKLDGRILPDSSPIKPLFDGLSVAVRAVFALSHSKAMAAYMNIVSSSLRLPEDRDASDALSFISDLINNHCQRSKEAKGLAACLKPRRKTSGWTNKEGKPDDPSSRGAVADDGQNSNQEVNLDDNLDDNSDDDLDDEAWAMESMGSTPAKNDSELPNAPVIFRRWIMSLVDHFASVRVLERASVKLPVGDVIDFSLLGVDHRRMTLPNWTTLEAIIRQLTMAASWHHREKYLVHLKAYIQKYETGDSLPGTAARYRDNVLLPFQKQLKRDPNIPLTPQIVTTCLHCEATLIAVMTYLATDANHDLGRFLQACSHLLIGARHDRL